MALSSNKLISKETRMEVGKPMVSLMAMYGYYQVHSYRMTGVYLQIQCQININGSITLVRRTASAHGIITKDNTNTVLMLQCSPMSKFIFWVPHYWHGLTLILAWISNRIHYKGWNEITYPFPNFNGATVDVWEWISNFIPHFTGHVITYPCWWKLPLAVVPYTGLFDAKWTPRKMHTIGLP